MYADFMCFLVDSKDPPWPNRANRFIMYFLLSSTRVIYIPFLRLRNNIKVINEYGKKYDGIIIIL